MNRLRIIARFVPGKPGRALRRFVKELDRALDDGQITANEIVVMFSVVLCELGYGDRVVIDGSKDAD